MTYNRASRCVQRMAYMDSCHRSSALQARLHPWTLSWMASLPYLCGPFPGRNVYNLIGSYISSLPASSHHRTPLCMHKSWLGLLEFQMLPSYVIYGLGVLCAKHVSSLGCLHGPSAEEFLSCGARFLGTLEHLGVRVP
mgnify:CR=1 FL=1